MIASEGKIILIPIIITLVIGVVINNQMNNELLWLKVFNYLVFLFLLFSLYFFRDPNRESVGLEKEMISPADGKIIQIIDIDDPEIGEATQIAIFLSVFNVHSQYVPIDGKVISINYHPGKYLVAYHPKTSQENEQSVTLFQDKENNKFKIKQIAGLIARRILNYMDQDQSVIKGDRLGFIRFGSRVEIIVPRNKFNIFVKEGDKVKSKISKIGIFK